MILGAFYYNPLGVVAILHARMIHMTEASNCPIVRHHGTFTSINLAQRSP